MHALRVLRASLASLTLTGVALAGGSEWHADFDAAQKIAQQSGKDMLIDFTGSDWCGWCIKLHKEVFDHAEFDEGVKNDFVLVALDFPKSAEAKAKVPNPKRNAELSDLHGIQGFPTILLMTAKGEVYGRTGYKEGGPTKYVEHLGELRTFGKKELAEINASIQAWDKAAGDAKLAAWDAIADRAEKVDRESPFVGLFVAPLEAGLALDAKAQQARRVRAVKALFKIGRASEGTQSAVRELDPRNEQGLLELALEAKFAGVSNNETAKAAVDALAAFDASSKFKDAELQLRLYTTAARWLSEFLEDAEAAKVWATKALALNPKDERQRSALEEIVG